MIDPGADVEKIVQQCQGLTVRHLCCSHGHRNHATAKDDLKALVGGETALSLLDAKAYLRSADHYVNDGDRLPFGDFELEVITTPGHSPGSLSFKVGNHLFTGDTLLKGNIGRTDVPDVDVPRQLVSVLSRLLSFPRTRSSTQAMGAPPRLARSGGRTWPFRCCARWADGPRRNRANRLPTLARW